MVSSVLTTTYLAITQNKGKIEIDLISESFSSELPHGMLKANRQKKWVVVVLNVLER